MERLDNTKSSAQEPDIVFSKMVSVGKRIYYIDVKKNRKDELFLTITESKKIINEYLPEQAIRFEKHKVFIYKEAIDRFSAAFNEAIDYTKENS